MTPMMISVIAFVAVSAVVGLVAFVLRDGAPKTSERLETLAHALLDEVFPQIEEDVDERISRAPRCRQRFTVMTVSK